MGALAAAVDKRGEKAFSKVVTMLKDLAHRGTDAHGIATYNRVKTAKSLDELAAEETNSDIAVGHNLSRIISGDQQPQPILGEGFAFAFDGRIFPPNKKSDVDEILEELKPDAQKKAGKIIERLDGSYVFAAAFPDIIIAGRDSLGISPLYCGENETVCAVASERKALWAIGIKDVWPFPPGNLALITRCGFSFKPVKPVMQPPLKRIKMENAAERLRALLLKSTRNRVADIKEVAVAFSGGLDSSLVAVLAKICGAKVTLISVGLENQPELRFAEEAAEALELPLHVKAHTLDDVEEVLPKVLWLIEETDPMKASIAIPFYWAAEAASKLGHNVLFGGQLGDELFGGYQKYLRKYVQNGTEAVQNAMFQDVVSSYDMNFQRDNQVCAFHKVELRLPLADREVVEFSLSLPVDLKIDSARGVRKVILRAVAKMLDMPPFIVNRPKKAIQYATGVDGALRRLARGKGLTLKEYIEDAFKEAYSGIGG
jgi:asparagine synthase (glutamine-hydrolysing)